RGSAPVVGHVHEIKALRDPEHLAQKMRWRSQSRRREAILASIGPGKIDELFYAGCRQGRVDEEGGREFDCQCNRLKIVVGIISHSFIKHWIDDMAVDGDQDGITIGSGLGSLPGTDVAAGAGDVLDIELSAEIF